MSQRAVPEMAFDASSSDDDDAPEEVSVSSSRLQSLSQMKDIKESLRKSKEDERERRRHRNEMFRIQKENKLRELSKRKLPEDVLQAISAKSGKGALTKEDPVPSKKTMTGSDENNEDINDSDEDEQNLDFGDDCLSDSGVEGSVDGRIPAEEFIPLRTGSHMALVTPSALAKTTETAAQRALLFKQSRLYDRHLPRESNKERKLKMEKRRVASHKK